ncbi:molecular chaperone [Limnohabitans sp. DCL3]|uniref:TorD/DmsD family molecular chaperone n=1 Tax=Limnohabitans sp. DCL3 TaxID=3374103 RepID=UPI003A8841E9
MSQDLHPAVSSHALDEETARAEIYGLLSQLFYAAPSAELLGQLQVAVTEAPDAGGFLEEPWRELVACARNLSQAQISAEYNSLFGGVGKPEVYLFGSHYLSGFLNEKPLVRLRDDLAELGLGRTEGMSETEDHVAYVFEVMRFLIAGDDVAVSNLTRQQAFFNLHVQSWLPALCQVLLSQPRAVFYARVAAFTEAFISVESQGFDLVV